MVELLVLGSGSGGNATVLRHGPDAILIDAGFSAKEVARRCEDAGVSVGSLLAVLVTHEHSDHVSGLRVFCKRHGDIPGYANAMTAERLGYMNAAPPTLKVFSNGATFKVGPFSIEPFSVSHDAVDPVGFVITCDGVRVAMCTDLGTAGKMVPVKLRGSHAVVLESNHDPGLLRASSRPLSLQQRILGRRGHLSNQHAAELLPQFADANLQHLVMAHLSEEANEPDLVDRTIGEALDGLKRRADVRVQVAHQHRACEPIAIHRPR